MRGVVQVHQAQQALDHRDARVGDGRADRGEHRGPAETDERVGHDASSVGASGAPKVAVTPVWSATRSGSQRTVTVGRAVAHRRQCLRPSAPAAMASTERMAAAASSVDDHRRAAVDRWSRAG